MYKVIDLGCEFSETGEPLVTLLSHGLTKTASSGIQKAWDNLSPNDKFSYLWVIGVSAYEYYGCNNNGDAFYEEDLKNNHNTFVQNAHVFLHHVNKDPRKSIGRPIFSWYNETMHRVELILQLDKSLPTAKETIGKIKAGEMIGVSMGCRVKHDVCSICGQKAKTRAEYCDHLRYNMKKILPDGRQVFAFNPDPKFFDISVVNKPADPIALTLDKVASSNRDDSTQVSHSADVGADSEYYSQKLAAIDKFSDIIKQVNGPITDVKDGHEDLNLLKNIDLEKLEYPMLGFQDMENLDIEPGCILHALAHHGAPPSLGEIVYAAGKHHMGREFKQSMMPSIFNMLPGALSILRSTGAPLEHFALPILMSGMVGSQGLKEIPEHVLQAVEPVAKTRVVIIKQAMEEPEREKFAARVLNELEVSKQVAGPEYLLNKSFLTRGLSLADSAAPANYDQFTVRGDDGQIYTADRKSIQQAWEEQDTNRVLKKGVAIGLAAAAAGALFHEKNLVGKLVPALGLGALAGTLWDTKDAPTVRTIEGQEIPASTLFHKKEASTSKFISNNLGTLAGMSVPAALGLDYLYNTKIKYKNHPAPEAEMRLGNRLAFKAGKAYSNNPLFSTAAGGVTGAVIHEGLRKLLRKGK